MKTTISVFCLTLCCALPALADKPEWAGNKNKPNVEQKQQHSYEMKNKHNNENYDDKKYQKDKLKDKQKNKQDDDDKRSESKQSEIEKQIENGREIEETGKKWWQIFNR